ncbi:MAG: hypothetical protein ACJ73S_25575, partial [Mycobacteriales bacterium]
MSRMLTARAALASRDLAYRAGRPTPSDSQLAATGSGGSTTTGTLNSLATSAGPYGPVPTSSSVSWLVLPVVSRRPCRSTARCGLTAFSERSVGLATVTTRSA